MPHASRWRVGNGGYRIAFNYQVLGNDKGVLHVLYGNAVRKRSEAIFNGDVDFDEAPEAAQKLVDKAMILLKGHPPDEELDIWADIDLGVYTHTDLDTLRGEDFWPLYPKALLQICQSTSRKKFTTLIIKLPQPSPALGGGWLFAPTPILNQVVIPNSLIASSRGCGVLYWLALESALYSE